jgi:HAD superfamily hydrolase (TIGR01549 family)
MNRLIFWDWNGTLVDESRMDNAVCMFMEKELADKMRITLDESVRSFQNYLVKLEKNWKWHDYAGHGRNLGIDWKKAQVENLQHLSLVPGAREILSFSKNKGFKNILTTNAVTPVILLRMDHIGLSSMFDMIIGSDTVKALKSEGRHFQKGLQELHGVPEASFSVGDNPVQDILPARKLGIHTIFCVYGKNMTHYHSGHLSSDHLQKPNSSFRIERLQQIKDIL